MAEGFETYHVPQQSRREKLRVLAQNQPGFIVESTTLLPLYDPPLIPSDLLTCSNQQPGHVFHNNHNNNVPLSANKENQGCSVQEESSNLMMGFSRGVVNGSSCSCSSSSVSQHAYLDPASTSIQAFNSNPFLYQPQSLQNIREFDHSYSGGNSEMMVFKPEPLSLSLSSHYNSNTHPLELNLQQYGPFICGDNHGGGGSVISSGCASNEVFLRNSVPIGPFTGYALILKGSRFLEPAQELLEEVCDVGVRGVYAEKKIAADDDASLMEPLPPPEESVGASGIGVDYPIGDGNYEGRKKNSRLLTILDEVYRRYRQYYQQMHLLVTSFEYVAGLGNAAPYASLAINAMSKHFRCLKNAITDQLQFISKTHFQIGIRKDESPQFRNNDRDPYSQRPGFLVHQQPVWRHQRGLPERAVSVLRAWLFEHFLHPYPTDTDKLMLAKQTGLSRSQVSNWFINARVRLWKPMVEEIHTLESQEAQKKSQREEHSSNKLSNDHLSSHHSQVTENTPTSVDKFRDVPYKSNRNEFPNVPVRSQEQLHRTNTSNQQVSVGVSMGSGGAGKGVSLTLGLHQNHGIGLSEPFPMSAAHRFGLAFDPEGCVISGFGLQNRHFGREVIGGQLLHDFVG